MGEVVPVQPLRRYLHAFNYAYQISSGIDKESGEVFSHDIKRHAPMCFFYIIIPSFHCVRYQHQLIDPGIANS